MVERLFGLETEYGISAATHTGTRVDSATVATELMKMARQQIPCVPGVSENGAFLGNGSRLYVDCGAHPEFATPEVSTPGEAVAYTVAGERILARLADEVARAQRWRVTILRGNVDYQSGTTFGRHESYLHLADPGVLAEQMIPHIVSRVIFGAGGFNPRSPGIEFSLSPRSAYFSAVSSDGSTGNRGIIHTKQEPLCGLGYRRFHVICPGDTLLSQTGIYLNIATTALIVALVEAGERPGDAVRLSRPVPALRTFAANPTCRARVRLSDGRFASAVEIQRHYLERVESGARDGRLPAWAPAACARWRSVLDRLEQGPDALAGTLDWATKLAVYRTHARERGFEWNSIRWWTRVVRSIHLAMQRAEVHDLTCEEAVGPNSPIRDAVEELTSRLRRNGERWERLREFVNLRSEFREIDTRWGELGATGIWSALDGEDRLTHRLPESERHDDAVSRPPASGRAKLRGEVIQEAHARGATGFHSDWSRVIDEANERMLDLSDPFVTEPVWRPLERHVERDRPAWPDLLRREVRFAGDHPGTFEELASLAQVLGTPPPGALGRPLARRAFEIIERSFPPDHPIVAACLRDLARRVVRGTRTQEATSLTLRAQLIDRVNRCRQSLGPEHADVALACNELAIHLRSLGRPSDAERLLREAVAIEDRALPADHPKRPHRLNNLASVLLMQDKREEARGLLFRAWQLQREQHDLTSARILCLRLALDWIEGREGAPFLGQLRTLLAEPHLGARSNISLTWNAWAIWDSLATRLARGRLALFRQINTVLDDRAGLAGLDELPVWSETAAVSLEAPWPERDLGRADPAR